MKLELFNGDAFHGRWSLGLTADTLEEGAALIKVANVLRANRVPVKTASDGLAIVASFPLLDDEEAMHSLEGREEGKPTPTPGITRRAYGKSEAKPVTERTRGET